MDLVENVMLPAMALPAFQRGSRAARRRAESLLESVGLGGRMRHTPFELSGGEQQRAALARSLMNNPDILFADEPTGNLDDATGETVLDKLVEMNRESQRALVVVTHSRLVASRCDRVLTLDEGVLM